ncbi:uncharacterized protein M6G45_004913 isoform 1-T1 [Spheniscus humboldti]
MRSAPPGPPPFLSFLQCLHMQSLSECAMSFLLGSAASFTVDWFLFRSRVLDCDMKLHQHKFGEPSIQKIELLMKNVLHSGKDGYIQEEDLSKSQLQYLKTGV